MRLQTAISLFAGGPGSGCNPEAAARHGNKCGPKGSGASKPTTLEDVQMRIEEYKPIFANAVSQFKSVTGKYGNIEGRIKTAESLYEKLSRKGQSLDEITDVIGLRNTVRSIKDVYRAVNDVKKNFNVLEEDDAIRSPKGGYYRAMHMLVEVDGRPVELQIRTQNQSRLAIWAHDTFYKAKGPNPQIASHPKVQKYLQKVSDTLLKLDQGKAVKLPICPKVLADYCFGTHLPFLESNPL